MRGPVASARATSSRLRSGSVSEDARLVALGGEAQLLDDLGGLVLRASRTLAQALSAPTMTFSMTDEAGERLDQLEGAADAGAADLVRPPAVDALAREAAPRPHRGDRRRR